MIQNLYKPSSDGEPLFSLEEIFGAMDHFEESVLFDLALYQCGGKEPTEELKRNCEKYELDFLRSELERLWKDKANRPAIKQKLRASAATDPRLEGLIKEFSEAE